MPPKKPTIDPNADSYKNLIDLLALYTEASNRMLALQADAQASFLETVDGCKTEYAELQSKLSEADKALETLVLAHPEWFDEKRRSIKTPYGTVKLTRSTSLDVPNPEATIILIEQAGDAAREKFLRPKTELNLEALGQLTDAELKPLRIKRVVNENFKVEPAKLDMGKAVAAADAAGKEAA